MTMTSTPAPGTGGLLVNVVRIQNDGDKDFVRKYGPRERLSIPAHQAVFVTEEVAWHFLGRWWFTNADPDPRRKMRAQEVNRLRTLYGAYEDDAAWEQQRPKLSCWTPDGKRVTTVVDDPEGDTLPAGTQLTRSLSLESQVEFLSQQLVQMQGRLDREHEERLATQGPDAQPDASPRPSTRPPLAVPGMGTIPTAPAPIPQQAVFAPGAPEAIAVPDMEFDEDGNPLPPRLGVTPEVHPRMAAMVKDGTAEPQAGELVNPDEPPVDGPAQAKKSGGVRVGSGGVRTKGGADS